LDLGYRDLFRIGERAGQGDLDNDIARLRPGEGLGMVASAEIPAGKDARMLMPLDKGGAIAGMIGQPPLAIDLAPLPGNAVVADMVYVPLETPLLAAARARGLRGVDGLGMLLHQARPGFFEWFGVAPQVDAELRAFVAHDIPAR
jgi:shikimate dehydrogenase